jgi:hypothetical protein
VLLIFKYCVLCSPKITEPKLIYGSSTAIKAFLHVHINGISILPVSLRIGNTAFISSFSYGVNVIVIVVDRPADIRPLGVYTMWKKSLILSSRGSNLKELNEKETLVNSTTCVCDMPTVKSFKRSEGELAYLKDDLIRLRDKGGSFEFTPCYDLRLYNSLFLADHCLSHILLFKKRHFWEVLDRSLILRNLPLPWAPDWKGLAFPFV